MQSKKELVMCHTGAVSASPVGAVADEIEGAVLVPGGLLHRLLRPTGDDPAAGGVGCSFADLKMLAHHTVCALQQAALAAQAADTKHL